MEADASECQKCGGPRRTVGGAPAGGSASRTAARQPELGLELEGLRHEVQRSGRLVWLLDGAALVLGGLLLALLVGLHFHEVMQYAEVGQLDVNPGHVPNEAEIRFVRQ